MAWSISVVGAGAFGGWLYAAALATVTHSFAMINHKLILWAAHRKGMIVRAPTMSNA
jgi:hypothetical protein